MTPLGHAEAHERLADLVLEPGGLERLGTPATDELTAHVVACETCSREVHAWRRTRDALEASLGSGPDRLDLGDLAVDEPIAVPAALRGTILGAVRDLPETRTAITSPAPVAVPAATLGPAALGPANLGPAALGPATSTAGRRVPAVRRLLPLVAVLAIVAVGTGLLADQSGRLDRARQESAALEAVTATLDRVLSDPAHRVVDLRGADGTVRGSLSWSSRDLVVLTTALEPPPPGKVYRCWIERDGVRSPMGQLWFAGGTAFWSGSLEEWATTSFPDGGTFGISLEPVSGPAGNPAILAADLGD
ncbi:MAG: hypothetical protein C0498_10460 [Anaerolinea sp.]|nr:hypothetical protein [Anaerolinea sp.]